MQYENERMEYKSQLTDDIYKEVIAFTNTDGGVIYIGIDDQGNVTGIDNVDETYTRLTNGIRDAIQPDVTMFVRYVLQENKVIRIEVGEGSYKPYYLKGKGLKPAGVYVRQGATSVQASPEQIRQMIKDSDGDVFEEMRTVQQNLTFDEAAVAFKRYKVDFLEEISELMEQKKKKVFQMTYQVGDIRYLMKGYGEQLTGGYSIQVEEVSESENAVFCKTRLIGPEKADAGSEPSYPCIVLKIRETEKPIEFLGFIIK